MGTRGPSPRRSMGTRGYSSAFSFCSLIFYRTSSRLHHHPLFSMMLIASHVAGMHAEGALFIQLNEHFDEGLYRIIVGAIAEWSNRNENCVSFGKSTAEGEQCAHC
jgi:hypothetical protein